MKTENLDNILNTDFVAEEIRSRDDEILAEEFVTKEKADKIAENAIRCLPEEEKPKNEIIDPEADIKFGMADHNFVRDELKKVINETSEVANNIKNEIKEGCPPRVIEVFAKLQDSRIKAIQELRDTNKLKTDNKIKEEELKKGISKNPFVGLGGLTQNNITVNNGSAPMASKDLLRLVKEAKTATQFEEIGDSYVFDTKEPAEFRAHLNNEEQ